MLWKVKDRGKVCGYTAEGAAITFPNSCGLNKRRAGLTLINDVKDLRIELREVTWATYFRLLAEGLNLGRLSTLSSSTLLIPRCVW